MIKKLMTTMVFSAFLLLLLPLSTAFAANQVQVEIPSFPVTLNGQTTGNTYSKYPLLVYRDITYVPMTYYDCYLMGLQTRWDENGLAIYTNGNEFYEYQREINTIKNAKKQTAQIATESISVNDKVINNKQEPYPLLVFRDVTYFPLTWHFAVEEFGWEYTFDQKTGLSIQNEKVKMKRSTEWSGRVDPFSTLAGTDDLRFLVNFIVPEQTYSLTATFPGFRESLSAPDLSLYNVSFTGATILPGEQWEYQIYRLIDDQPELLYRQKIPFFSGYLPAHNFASTTLDIPFWKSEAVTKGTYQIRLMHPDQYRYQDEGSNAILTEPVKPGIMGSLRFEGIIEITK